jgi:hypothetical protein
VSTCFRRQMVGGPKHFFLHGRTRSPGDVCPHNISVFLALIIERVARVIGRTNGPCEQKQEEDNITHSFGGVRLGRAGDSTTTTILLIRGLVYGGVGPSRCASSRRTEWPASVVFDHASNTTSAT